LIDDHDLFERAVERFAPPEDSFERLARRRDRKHRNKRITAGVVALIVVAAGTGAFMQALTSGSVPADPPEEPTMDLGIFEPVAGRIVYCKNSDLWSVDPSAPTPASTLERVNLEGTGDPDRPCASFTVPLGWSSDGTKLLYVREDPADDSFPYRRHLYILHADGAATRVTPEPVGGAAISPDGWQVVFTADGGGLYAVDAEGGQPVRIAEEGESPTFSPDGARIAYLAEGPHEQVWVANADGTDAHQILPDDALAKGMGKLTWSPAGDRIAIENQQEGHVAIYTFAPDGSDFTEVITGGFNHSWSPDGSHIAFGLPGRDGLSIADADGSNVRTLSVGAAGPWHPRTLEESVEGFPSPSPSISTGSLDA
jgi:dipeptidyl aminopeptidase/acylaminoacyl peptidase